MFTENPGPTRRSLGNEGQRGRNIDVKILQSQLRNFKDLSPLEMMNQASKRNSMGFRDVKGRSEIQKKEKSLTPLFLKALCLNLLVVFVLYWSSKPSEVMVQGAKNNLIGVGNERGMVSGVERMSNLDLEFERLNQELEQLIESSQKSTFENWSQAMLFCSIGVLLLQILVWFVYMILTS